MMESPAKQSLFTNPQGNVGDKQRILSRLHRRKTDEIRQPTEKNKGANELIN